MIQTIFQFVHANALPVFMIIGCAGFVCCMVADHIKNKELKRLIEDNQTIQQPEPDCAGSPGDKVHDRPITNGPGSGVAGRKSPASALSPKVREKMLCLNVAGYLLMLTAMIALWRYGYFDPYLAKLFPNG